MRPSSLSFRFDEVSEDVLTPLPTTGETAWHDWLQEGPYLGIWWRSKSSKIIEYREIITDNSNLIYPKVVFVFVWDGDILVYHLTRPFPVEKSARTNSWWKQRTNNMIKVNANVKGCTACIDLRLALWHKMYFPSPVLLCGRKAPKERSMKYLGLA